MHRQEEKAYLALKNLAHVFLDGELAGTTLEGSNLSLSTSYFKEFLTWLNSNKGDEFDLLIKRLGKSSLTNAHDLDKLVRSLDTLLKIENNLDKLPAKLEKTYPQNKDLLQEALNYISQDVLNEFKKTGDVYIPGGWAGQPGHQMIYRLTQEKDQIVFRIYNTGAGIEYHGAIPRPSGKNGYYPIFGLRINKAVHNNDLIKILTEVFRLQVLPNLEPSYKFSAEDIYIDVILGALAWLQQNIQVIPPAELAQPILGQRSGTCVFKSLTHVIREHFNDKQSFRIFLLAYRLYLLKQEVNLKAIASVAKTIPDYANYLDRCVANTMRMLDEELKPKIKSWNIALADRKKIEVQLEVWQNIVNTSPLYPLNHIITQLPKNKEQKETKINLLSSFSYPKAGYSDEEEKPQREVLSFKNKTFYKGLQSLDQARHIGRRDLENFCVAYAKNSPLIQHEEKVDADYVLKAMEKILYKHLKFNEEISPRSLIIRLSLMMLMDKLCNERLWVIGKNRLSCLALYSEHMGGFIRSIDQNPFIGTRDASLDVLWENVREFYKEASSNRLEISWLSYYTSLIEAGPEEEKNLIKLQWEKDKLDPKLKKQVIELFGNERDAYCASFLKEPKNFKQAPQLQNTFDTQRKIEAFLIKCLAETVTQLIAPRYKSDLYPSSSLYLNLGNLVHLFHPLSIDDKYDLRLNPKLYSNYYKIEDTTVKNVLTSYYDGCQLNSHNVSFLTPGTNFHPTNPPDLNTSTSNTIRSRSEYSRIESLLHQFRFSPTLFINTILAELTQRPEWLINKDFQQYIELSLFQPSLLLNELRVNSRIIRLLTNLVTQNRHSENPSYPGTGEWFMLNLAVKVANYALEGHNNGLFTLPNDTLKEINQLQQTLLQAIDRRLQTNLSVEAQRQLQFLKLSVLYTQNTPAEELSTFLILLLLPEAIGTEHYLINEQINSILEKSHHKMINFINANSLSLETITVNAIQLLRKIDSDNPIWKSEWKIKSSAQGIIELYDNNNHNLEINISKKEISLDNSKLSFIPTNLIFQNQYQDLFGHTSQLSHYKNKYYYWEKNNTEWRYHESGNHIALKSNDKWYILTAPTFQIATASKYPQVAFNNETIYPLFNQARYQVWVKAVNDYFIIDKTTKQKVYEYKNVLLSRLIEPSGIVSIPKDVPAELLRLEDKKFIEFITLADSRTCWHLPRYNLSFIQENNALKTLDQNFELLIPTTDVFGSGLIFKSLQNRSETYVIPIQRYYTGKNAPKIGAHYLWVHDFSNLLAENSRKADQAFKGWDFTNTEEIARYNYQNNEIDAKKSSYIDKLYLAYLYLAQDQAEKAHEILSTNKFQNTPETLQLLWWTITQLAVGKPISNPRTIAVQMLAFHILIDLKEQHPDFLRELSLRFSDSETGNYAREQHETLINFLNTIALSAKLHYELYDNVRNNIPAALRLTKAAEEWLLAYCYKTLNTIPTTDNEEKPVLGSLGTRYFESISASGTDNVSYYPSTNIITTKITESLNDYNSRTRAISENVQSCFEIDSGDVNSISLVLANLSPWSSSEYIIKNFVRYYQVAKQGSTSDIAKLKSIVQAIFHTSSLRAKSKQESERFVIAAILLTIINNSKVLPANIRDLDPKKPTLKFDDIVDRIHSKVWLGTTHTKLILNFLTYNNINIPHHIKSKAKNLQLSLPETSRIDFGAKDRLPAQFASLKKELQSLHSKFETQQHNLLAELKHLESDELNLKQQDELLFELDKNLLDLQNNLHAKQIKLLTAYKQKLQPEIVELPSILQDIKKEQKAISQSIDTMLSKRSRPIVKELGKQKTIPTLASLVKLYALNTINDYQHMGFSTQDIPNLKKLIEAYINLHDSERRLEILTDEISKDNSLGIITAILSHNQAAQRQDAIFQYIEKLALRPAQSRMLKLLVQNGQPELFTSQVLQLIMGGGKTKVIMPILLNMLADGHSLPIAIFPDMLLHTNYSDISNTANKVFHQESFLFLFHRNSPSSSVDLQYIYERFESAMHNKMFMATSVASLQSLGLKYIEILYHRSKGIDVKLLPETEMQLKWLEKILLLLNTKGKAVIDEAHQLLHIRKELNYAIGQAIPINNNIIESSINLFTWLNKIVIPEGLISETSCTFTNLLSNSNLVADQEKIAELMRFYVNALVKPSLQPIWLQTFIINKLTPTDLKAYLLVGLSGKDETHNQTNHELEQKIYKALEAYPEVMANWILLREQLNALLVLTLQKKLHENYGKKKHLEHSGTPSNQDNYPFAIPYRANNMPTPYVFANFMEIINYTAQMFYGEGISLETFTTTLREWQAATEQLRQQGDVGVSDAEIIFNRIFKNTNHELQTLDLNDKMLIADLHRDFHKHPLLLQEVLKATLNKITIDEAILRCDSLNLAAMLFIIYAFSGTPSNYRTYHSKIKMTLQSSLLTESQLIYYLKTKQTKILKSTPLNTKPAEEIDFIINQALFAHPNACALIDCGARLRGLSNFQTADKIAFYAKGKKNLRYILFYQEDELFAYDTSKDINQTPIKLSNTDPDTIKNELNNCLPDQRYTYYDQDHITGADILQPLQGVGIVTVDLQTGISTFLQADGRMRGLDKQQEIIVVIPPELENILLHIDPLENLLNIMRTNQRLQLEIDHFQAALKSVRNHYRENLLSRLMNQPTAKARDALFLKSTDFFVEKQSDDIIKIYQQRSELQDIGIIMNSICQDIRNLWLRAVADQPQELIRAADQILSAKTKLESQKAILICKNKESFPPPQWGKQVQAQQQVQTQAQAQLQKQMQQENEVNYDTQPIKQFNFAWINSLDSRPNKILAAVMKHNSLQSILSRSQTLELDPHIYATEDFLIHTKFQTLKNFHNNALNHQPCVFLACDTNYRNIALLLLSAEEAKLLNSYLLSSLRPYCWFSTYDGYTFPEASYPSAIQVQLNLLLEQAAFLTGRIDYLSSTKNLNWLRMKSEEKLTFFRDVIQPAYGIPENHLTILANSLMKLDSQHIRKWSDPNLDTAQVNTWKLSLPHTLRKRFDKILPYLDELRSTALVTHKVPTAEQLIDEGIIENDAQLVEAYGKSLLSSRDYFDSALYIICNPQVRIRQFINASLDNLPNSLINATMIAVAISSRQTELVWLKDLVEDMHYLYGKINFQEPCYREILNFLYDSDLLDTFSLRTSYQTKKLEALVALWKNNILDVESIKALLKKPDMNFITKLADHKALNLKIVNQALQAENLLLPQFSEYLLTLSQNNLLFPWSAQKVFQDENIWPATQAYIESRLTEPNILLNILNNARFAQLITQLCQNRSYNSDDLVELLKSSVEQLEILQGTLQSLQNFSFEIDASTIAATQKPALNKALTILHNVNKSPYSKNRIDMSHAKAIIQSILHKPNLLLSLNADLLNYCIHEQQIAFISGMIKSASVQDLHNLIQTNYFDSFVTNKLSLISYLSEVDPTIFINIFERAAMTDLTLVVNKWLANKTIDFEESPELFHILIEKDPLWVTEQIWDFKNLPELKQTFEQVRNYIYQPAAALQSDQSADNFLHYLKSHVPIHNQEMKEEKFSPPQRWHQVLQESRQYIDSLIQKELLDSKRQLYQKNKDQVIALQLRLVSEKEGLDNILAINQIRNISDRDIKHILNLISANCLELRYSTFMIQFYDLRSEQVTKNILNQVGSVLTPSSQGLFAVNNVYQKVFDSLTASLMKKVAVYAIVTSDNTDYLLKSRIANCFDTDFDKAKTLLQDDIRWSFQSLNSKVGWDLIERQFVEPLRGLLSSNYTQNQFSVALKELVESFEKTVSPGLVGPKI